MEIIQIIGLGVVGAFLSLILRHTHPEISMLLRVAIGIIILVLLLGYLEAVLDVISDLARKSSINWVFLETLLKVIGVAYLAEFASQVCEDAGEKTTAGYIQLAGKLAVLVMAVPIIVSVLEAVLGFLP